MSIESRRERCISCGTTLAEDIVFVGPQYPSAIFLSASNPLPMELRASSLNLTRCANEDCTLIQLSHEYNLQYVFDHYPYESGTTATMTQILQAVLDDAESVRRLGADDVVLDIGGNDGSFLSLIKTPVRARVNIDAAAGVAQRVTAPDYHHVHAKFDADVYRRLGLPSPKLITSVAMFYHLSDPLSFIRSVADIMDDESIWVLQMTYVGTMLRDNILDNIVHEHVAYYSLFSLEAMLARVGLHIAEARLVESYGGSLRVFIVKDAKAFPPGQRRRDYPAIVRFEAENRTNTFEALYAFDGRVQLLRESLREIVTHLASRHGPMWAFGASTKGNMILQFIGAGTNQIECILDNSRKKVGSTTTGSLIPIVDEAEYLTRLPDYLLILPYYYKETFFRTIRRALPPGKSVHLLIPLPHPHFVTLES